MEQGRYFSMLKFKEAAIGYLLRYHIVNVSLVGEVFLEQCGKLELAILHPPPLHQVEHVRAEEQYKGY